MSDMLKNFKAIKHSNLSSRDGSRDISSGSKMMMDIKGDIYKRKKIMEILSFWHLTSCQYFLEKNELQHPHLLVLNHVHVSSQVGIQEGLPTEQAQACLRYYQQTT
ncbi:UPF0160 protein-like [Iris pallida]|uniref:UPF0160 protein-like n=1 Tax=Iris pallida TaxID=29817 RepID=A0AAX6DG32_IRIPA|nr:UPF0160 protein-like [Iris pallida]